MNTLPRICKILDATTRESVLREASDILQKGGVLVCATDTGYLLGVDGLNPAAIRKIYRIKGRSFDKPIHVVVSDLPMARKLVSMDAQAQQIFQRFLPGPLTLIVKKKALVPDLLVSGLEGLGLRIPQNAFLLQLVKMSAVPITATSANRSGCGTPYSVEQALAELGTAAEYVDLFIDQGATQHAMPSTILDLTRIPPKILREGPITRSMLAQWNVV